MSWSLYFSTLLTSYLARFRLTSTTRGRKEGVTAVFQTSPSMYIFHPVYTRRKLMAVRLYPIVLSFPVARFRHLHSIPVTA